MQTATVVQGRDTACRQHPSNEIENAVVDAETWAGMIEQSAAESNALVGEMTGRLDAIARGTDAFASAMEQVAASSEQQSASTQEIAAAASMLATASEQLSRLVSTFRTDRGATTLADLLPAPTPSAGEVVTEEAEAVEV